VLQPDVLLRAYSAAKCDCEPGTSLGELTALPQGSGPSPRLPAGFKGAASRRGGRGMEGEVKDEKRREGGEGEGKEVGAGPPIG